MIRYFVNQSYNKLYDTKKNAFIESFYRQNFNLKLMLCDSAPYFTIKI